MRLPEHFDSNEWFILVICLFLIVLTAVLKRRMYYSQITVIFTLNFFLGASLDYILAGPPHDFYDIMDVPEFEVFDLIIYLFIYPFSGYLLLYFLDLWKLKGFPVIFYVFFSSFMTTGLEWLANQFNVYEHNVWTYYHSFIAYYFIYCVNACAFYWIKKARRTISEQMLEE